ncbi:hypothetical protein SLS62_009319 [Diatrype stigma]|uniref:CENP-V/GFA domain-containing protein n=1 Tax=Diatrype stigma TaxID=117547 RepID=A0AAN9YIT1_9PEZI
MAIPEPLMPLFNRDKVGNPVGEEEKQTFAARCHCSNVQFAITLPKSMLPLNAYVCGCYHCRVTHGAFGSFHITLPPGLGPEWTAGRINYSVYKTKGGNGGQRFFCPTCGAHSGHYEPLINQWVVDVALFDSSAPFWTYTHFAFPQSARDGGLLSWIPEIAPGRPLLPFSPPNDQAQEYELVKAGSGEERLRAECHCGGVSFTVGRPTEAMRGDAHLGRYVSPADPAKWKALLDFCRDCRKATGVPCNAWALVPRAAIEPADAADLRALGTMKTYASSGASTRGFCGACGATVFTRHRARVASEESEQLTVLNVAVGILRAPEGAKAENWLTWRTGEPAFAGPEDDARTFDPQFVEAVVEGHRKWGVEKYGDVVNFPVV